MKVMVVSHEWERLAPGGAQRSASALAYGLATERGCEVCLASAIRDTQSFTGQPERLDNGSLLEVQVESETDGHTFTWLNPSNALRWEQAFESFSPDVVHLHHYYQVGIDLPLVVRSLFPSVPIILTLHEYLAICLQMGQMVDTSGNLCLSSSAVRCGKCVDWPIERAFVRESYLRLALDNVDAFIAPSHFARERYIHWGLPADRIHNIPNALDLEQLDRKHRARGDLPLRVVYIGQFTPFKGVEVLLEALRLAETEHAGLVRADFHGGGGDAFGSEYTDRISRAQAAAASSSRFFGPYQQRNLPEILDGADLLVVPSTWWENSPVVIEEALARRVPVVCSDIGGMSEKVRHGVDGFHFQVGNPAALADLLVRLALQPEQLQLNQMRRPAPLADVVQAHIQLYKRTLKVVTSRT